MAASVPVTVEAIARTSAERAFDAIVPIDLSLIFTGFGPLPGVAAVRDQTGVWDHPGATRTVHLSDGSTAREAIVVCERPAHFAYRLDGFTGPLRHLVEAADGEWRFEADGGSATAVRWTYAFQPRSRRGAAVLVRLVVAPLWRAYARRVLARAVGVAERGG